MQKQIKKQLVRASHTISPSTISVRLDARPRTGKTGLRDRPTGVLAKTKLDAQFPAWITRYEKRVLNKLPSLINAAKTITLKRVLLVCGPILFFAFVSYNVAYFWPRTVNFSFSKPNCYFNPLFLPDSLASSPSSSYTLSHSKSVTFNKYPLFSKTTCIHLSQPPKENAVEKLQSRAFGISWLNQRTTINSMTLPKASLQPTASNIISIKDALLFNLDQADSILEYRLSANNLSVWCDKQAARLSCDIQKLNLAQAHAYNFILYRTFKGADAGQVLKKSFTTVTPIEVASASITPGTTVYSAPTDVSVTFNKTIKDYSGVALKQVVAGGQLKEIETALSQQDNKLVIAFKAPLPRVQSFELSIQGVTATDKGFLPLPYTLKFHTSGGPKVLAKNIGAYGIDTAKNFTLSFDSEVLGNADAAKYFTILSGGSAIPLTVSVHGKSVTLDPGNPLPRCASFTLKVANGLKNIYGVSGSSAWAYSSRTICQVRTSIGTSVKGRPIVAYRFGGGPSKILFVGATHGNEFGSKYVLDSLINDLEANYTLIPQKRTIVVIPALNPDGVAMGTRVNAHNVDLNRNFGANDWKADVKMPGGSLVKNGGGTAPLSEPESRSLANLVKSESFRLVLSYHSKASLVIANESGDSRLLAAAYGSKSGYHATGESQLGNTFAYDTTGSFEGWMHDVYGLPVLVIEHHTHTSNEFYLNKSAMWQMIQLQ